ncbi:efflux RND transporter periplasmic adaptor subunit [Hydrogenophaga defluvii]|uniref:Efflux RND transporter periplasmic adaptor subunit n=1 Tax=Hydrogenophaga defluvii TaxID=249410 RepID=A0ABW2SC90_9BURK
MSDTASTPVPAPAAVDLSTLLAEPASGAWYRRPAVWLGLVLLLFVAGSAAWWWRQRAADATPVYTSQPVARGNLTLTVTANGTLQPTRSINIGSELSGTVLQVKVDVNDRVSKGQVLVVLDTAKLRGQILRSRAALAAARGKTAQTTATLAQAQTSLERLQAVARLSDGKVPSKAELDTGRAVAERALADHASALAGIDDATAALATDEINLAKASIAAPADGVVLSRSVEPGNAVAASLQAVTLLVLADDLTHLRLWVYVDEADVGAVLPGQSASFTVSAYPTRQYPARITRVGLGSTITDNVVTYLTHLDVDNADGSLRPGMTASAAITATQRTDVLLVPNAALRFAPTLAGSADPRKKAATASLLPTMPRGNTRRSAASGASTATARQVWVLPEGGQAGKEGLVAVAVLPGISDGRMTEIVGGDLRVGMRVVTDQKSTQP